MSVINVKLKQSLAHVSFLKGEKIDLFLCAELFLLEEITSPVTLLVRIAKGNRSDNPPFRKSVFTCMLGFTVEGPGKVGGMLPSILPNFPKIPGK